MHSALGTFAERVVISAVALKFAFLKESLTSACFSFRKVPWVFFSCIKTEQNTGSRSCVTLAK